MIKVSAFGGLGNQLFQFAAANSLAVKHGTSVKIILDKINALNGDKDFTVREFELDNVLAPKSFTKGIEKSLIYKLGNKIVRYSYYLEKNLVYRDDFWSLPKNVILDGYFQSYKYIDDYYGDLIKCLTFPSGLSKKSKTCKKLILNSENTVAIHVRRGDYVTNQKTASTHGRCSLGYYAAGLDKLCLDEKNLIKVFFSDDAGWVKNNFDVGENDILVDWNMGSDSYQDLHLMSLCKNFVIANSSFSWWGAYIAQNPSKKVIAPKNWFKSQEKSNSDLISPSWYSI